MKRVRSSLVAVAAGSALALSACGADDAGDEARDRAVPDDVERQLDEAQKEIDEAQEQFEEQSDDAQRQRDELQEELERELER